VCVCVCVCVAEAALFIFQIIRAMKSHETTKTRNAFLKVIFPFCINGQENFAVFIRRENFNTFHLLLVNLKQPSLPNTLACRTIRLLMKTYEINNAEGRGSGPT